MKTVLMISHDVKDYSEWKKEFDAGETMRNDAGVKVIGVFKDENNANNVTVITEVPSAEAAKGLLTNAELKATMEKAGVISEPVFKILNNVNN